VTDLVRSRARLYPVGRLDADTTGLLVLTNDGALANRLMHPRFEVPKVYRVRVKGLPSERTLRKLRDGVDLEEGRTAPADATVVDRLAGETVIEIEIHEGRKRQVRRMFEAVGNPVLALERTRYGPLELGELAPGKSRRLLPEEVERLKQAGPSFGE
jgi:pseudouridine synthase